MSAAPYACSGVTTYGALRKLLDVYPAEPIVVIGAGGLGLMCLSILKALGGKGAVVVDIDERKRRAALECGALAAVDSKDPHVITEIPRAAQGPVRGVVDLVGSPETAALGFDLLPKGGKLVIVGLCLGAARLGRCRSSRSRRRQSRAAMSAISRSYASSLSSLAPARSPPFPLPDARSRRRAPRSRIFARVS